MDKIPFLISNMELKQNIMHEACQAGLHNNYKVIIYCFNWESDSIYQLIEKNSRNHL